MALNLAIASVSGVLIPYGLHKVGSLPCDGGSVILTTAHYRAWGFLPPVGLAALSLV